MAFDPDAYLAKQEKKKGFDPDAYLAKTKPETALQTFGRSSASLADTALNTLRGVADIPVRAAARAYYGGMKGVPLEQQEPLLQNVSNAILPQQDSFGKMFGVTGTPGYESAPLRQLGTYAGETIGQNVVQPLAEATGLPEGYVGDITNIGMMGVAPAIPKVVSAGQKAVPIIKAPIEVGKGFYQGVRGVEPGSQKSAVVPLRDTYYPPEMVNAYMRGEIDLPTLQAGQQPSKSLFATPEQQSALRMAERMPGNPDVPLIPVQGKGMQAFGERVGREYITDPYRAAADIGLSVVAGMPLPLSAAQRALQARQSRTLSQAANFDPSFRQKLMQDMNQPAIPPAPAPGPVNPATMTYPLTVQGPGQQLPPSVMVAPDLSRRVNIEGQSSVLPSQINTTQSQSARAPQTTTPAIDIAQLAAQRSAQMAQQSQNPIQQTAIQQVTGTAQPSISRQRTIPPQPATTTRASQTVRQELNAVDDQMTSLRDNALSQGIKPDTPQGVAYRQQLNDMTIRAKQLQTELNQVLELEKKQARAAKKKAPSNVSQMLTDDAARTFNALKSAGESPLEQKIAGMTQVNRDRLEATMRQIAQTKPGDNLMQEYLNLFEKYRIK